MYKNCAFPGVSQSTRGIIANICNPLIIPHRKFNAKLIKKFITTLPAKIAIVVIFALSALAYIILAVFPN
jgi:hypothetical protein